jgi:penicillin-binding protein 1A
MITAVMAAGVLAGGFLGGLMAVTQDLPQVEALQTYEPSAVTTILSADGRTIQSLFIERRIPVPLEDIPAQLVNAIIAVEDSRFYQHFGIDLKGITRALIQDIRHMKAVQGGSTLTQQLAKVLFLTPEKKLIRKIREAVLAINIERRYTKDEILTFYLNQIYLGDGAYGVEAAARTYFGVSVTDLDLVQCAMLAGLPRSPTRYSPRKNPDLARTRMQVVLRRLQEEGYISEAVYRANMNADLGLTAGGGTEDRAPYFTEMVRQELETQLGANLLYRGGLTVETTLDLTMQSAARDAVLKGISSYEKRHPGADPEQQVQSALVAIDTATGEIRALVGGRDFTQSPFNRAVQARRQPGSSFKPILFAAALSTGVSPADILSDSPLEIAQKGQKKPWVPRNYSGKYNGPVTVRTALEKSLNAATIDLLMKVGYQPVMDLARQLGVTADLKPYPTLGLGVFDVSLLEMVTAYATFANGGIRSEPTYIRRVMDREGTVLWETPISQSDVMEPQEAFQITNLMEGVITRGTGRRAASLGRNLAGKTGTTDEYRDAWFIGYSGELAAGVWTGFDRIRTLGHGEAGSRAALPVWIDFMRRSLKDSPNIPFKVPERIVLVEVDPATGLLAGPGCPATVVEAFTPGTAPKARCSHQVHPP